MQFYFRKHHSAVHLPASSWKNIKFKHDAGGVIGAGFLDLKKSFYTVNRHILLTPVKLFVNMLKWVESNISRMQCVKSTQHEIHRYDNLGVPQGLVLGPLWLYFIHQRFVKCPPTVICQIYADDAVLYVHANNKKFLSKTANTDTDPHILEHGKKISK